MHVGGLWVCSFTTVEGQPEWTLFLDRRRPVREWLCVRKGRVALES